MRFHYLASAAIAAQAFAAPSQVSSASPASSASPILEHWLYNSQVDDTSLTLLERPDIVGIQALYSWKSLEPVESNYTFTALRSDYEKVIAKGKKFWVQLQDRSFNASVNPVPQYLQTSYYDGGSAPDCDGTTCDGNFTVTGWVAQQWNPRVRHRYQALLHALAEEFDGKITGINLPETSISVDENANNYTNESYFLGELENAGYAASAFKKSYAVQNMSTSGRMDGTIPTTDLRTHSTFTRSTALVWADLI